MIFGPSRYHSFLKHTDFRICRPTHLIRSNKHFFPYLVLFLVVLEADWQFLFGSRLVDSRVEFH